MGFNLQNAANIPAEMRNRQQWILTIRLPPDAKGKSDKPPVAYGNWACGSSTNTHTWRSFDDIYGACQANLELDGTSRYYPAYVISPNDNIMGIDFDDHGTITADESRLAETLLSQLQGQTYIEHSSGGKGLHIFVQDNTPISRKGFRTANIEMYTQGRYIVMTGELTANAISALGTVDTNAIQAFAMRTLRPDSLNQGTTGEADYLTRVNAIMVQDSINQREILEGLNLIADGTHLNQKFWTLYQDGWAAAGYPSGSEADMSLLSIAANFTRDTKALRVVWDTAHVGSERLGKHNRGDYFTATLQKVLSERAIPSIVSSGLLNHFAAVARSGGVTSSIKSIAPPSVEDTVAFEIADHELPKQSASIETIRGILRRSPPMFAWAIKDVFDHLLNPTYEMAAVIVLGTLSLLAGRVYSTPVRDDKINLFFLITAPSGAGKADMNNAVTQIHDRLMVGKGRASLWESTDAVSREGIHRVLYEGSGNVLVQIPEASTKLASMSSPHANTAHGVMRMLLDCYNVTSLAPLSRAKAADSSKSVLRPNINVLAEGTESVFDAMAHPDIVVNGFPSRFIVMPLGIPHDTVSLNSNGDLCSDAFLETLQPMVQAVEESFAAHSVGLVFAKRVEWAEVTLAAQVQDMMRKQTLAAYRGEGDPQTRILRNRVIQNAIRVASLIAIHTNPHAPVIDGQLMGWAYDLVNACAANMVAGIKESQARNSTTNLDVLRAALVSYLSTPNESKLALIGKGSQNVINAQCVTKRALSVLMQKAYQGRAGNKVFTDMVIREAVEQGLLHRVDAMTFGTHGDYYRILIA